MSHAQRLEKLIRQWFDTLPFQVSGSEMYRLLCMTPNAQTFPRRLSNQIRQVPDLSQTDRDRLIRLVDNEVERAWNYWKDLNARRQVVVR